MQPTLQVCVQPVQQLLPLPAPPAGAATHILLSSLCGKMSHDQRQRVQVASLERMQCSMPATVEDAMHVQNRECFC